MRSRTDIARLFDEMASALELLGANRFRVISNQRVARVLRDLDHEIEELAGQDDAVVRALLTNIPGIGGASAKRILEYLADGRITEHERLLEQVPAGLFAILELPGVGPKAVKAMWEQLGITSLDELESRLDELGELPRMGAKKVDSIGRAIAFKKQAGDRVPIGLARPIAVDLRNRLRVLDGVERCEFAGSVRRGVETIGDLDFLVASTLPELVRDAFTGHPAVTDVTARGDTRCAVRLRVGRVFIQADLRIVPKAVFGAALMYFTGSKDHNIRLRERSIKQGRRLNEYGLFEGTEERPQDHGAEPLAAETEEEIYETLGLRFVPPEMREDRGELIESSADDSTLRVIERGEIRSDLHAHTVASDGRLTIEELAAAARGRGLHTIAVTDHSSASVVANGLSADRLLEHVAAVRSADRAIADIRILAGAEVDILPDGSLDYTDEILAQLDIVVASPHLALSQSSAEATSRLLAAIRHPLVDIIGHPSGRKVLRRKGLSPEWSKLFRAAADSNTALELNANWSRLDLRESHVRAARAAGCLLAIDTDTHRETDFDNLVYGVLTARRAGLLAEECVNTWSREKLERWLGSKRSA